MWATARYDLRLSSEEFYSLTPKQFDALLNRHKRETGSHEFLFGQLTSWVANTGFRTTEEPTKASDFMPSASARTAAVRTSSNPSELIEMTPERRAAVADALRAIFPR